MAARGNIKPLVRYQVLKLKNVADKQNIDICSVNPEQMFFIMSLFLKMKRERGAFSFPKFKV